MKALFYFSIVFISITCFSCTTEFEPGQADASDTTEDPVVDLSEDPAVDDPVADDPVADDPAVDDIVSDEVEWTGIIVDNRDIGLSVTGYWETCGREECSAICYGIDFLYADPRPTGDDTPDATATFTPELPVAGNYDVYIWWPEGDDRATDAPVAVNHADGTANFNINLRINGDYWYGLGTYYFNQGTEGNIYLEDSTTGYVNADAVRFVNVD